jgi:hypothetical protein
LAATASRSARRWSAGNSDRQAESQSAASESAEDRALCREP